MARLHNLISDRRIQAFLLSAIWGSLGFSLTWITLSALFSILGLQRKQPAAAYGILICSLLVGSSFALQAHWALDYLSTWYVTPIDPPLELKYKVGKLWLIKDTL